MFFKNNICFIRNTILNHSACNFIYPPYNKQNMTVNFKSLIKAKPYITFLIYFSSFLVV